MGSASHGSETAVDSGFPVCRNRKRCRVRDLLAFTVRERAKTVTDQGGYRFPLRTAPTPLQSSGKGLFLKRQRDSASARAFRSLFACSSLVEAALHFWPPRRATHMASDPARGTCWGRAAWEKRRGARAQWSWRAWRRCGRRQTWRNPRTCKRASRISSGRMSSISGAQTWCAVSWPATLRPSSRMGRSRGLRSRALP